MHSYFDPALENELQSRRAEPESRGGRKKPYKQLLRDNDAIIASCSAELQRYSVGTDSADPNLTVKALLHRGQAYVRKGEHW